jgi:hypothetical protein
MNSKHAAKVFLAITIWTLAASPYARSFPRITYTLQWANKSEELTYQSTGCADACWIAELRERKTKRVKARLLCDGSNLHGIYPAKSSQRDLQRSCAEMNWSTEKMDLIPEEMRNLVGALDSTK